MIKTEAREKVPNESLNRQALQIKRYDKAPVVTGSLLSFANKEYYTETKMLSDSEIDDFVIEQKPKNTVKKTKSDVGIFKRWLAQAVPTEGIK